MRRIGTMTGEGFSSEIWEDDDGRVHFQADADIDADGANGQGGQQAAYMVGNAGSEDLANGGMRMQNGKVVFSHAWGRSIVVIGDDNQPKEFPGGIIASKTWYRHWDKAMNDPAAYVDAQTVPYIVVPPLIVQETVGVVRGCKARATWKGRSVDCVVADLGPSNKNGELSIAAAKALGMSSDPRNGGVDEPEILYELWPGIPAPGYELQPA